MTLIARLKRFFAPALRTDPAEEEREAVLLLRTSHLFDSNWYLSRYRDVAAAGAEPVLHYYRHGASEGRDPGPTFSTRGYIERHPELAHGGVNPLVHWLRTGGESAVPPTARSDLTAGQRFFEGSRFSAFATGDPLAITRLLVTGATPAESLARVDPAHYSPTISIIMPTYNTPPRLLREVVQSVLAQTYTRWELCIVDDGSTSRETAAVLADIEGAGDPRVRVTRMAANGGIAKASDAALMLATGDYVGFVDHDDLLTPNALSEVVAVLREDRDVDYIYTDHAIVDADGIPKHYARKPGWSPEFLLSTNYIVHFKVVRRRLLIEAGGVASETSHVQDLGMSLRLMRAGAKVRHLPRIAYLWRDHQASVASSSAAKPGIEGLLVDTYNAHLRATGGGARHFWPQSFRSSRTGVFRLAFDTTEPPPAALVLVMRGSGEAVAAVRERFEPLARPGLEIHVVSTDVGAGDPEVRRLPDDAAIAAFVDALAPELVVVANSSIRSLGPDWLGTLIGYLTLDEGIGAVGGKTLDDVLRVRSAGMLLDSAGAYRTICGGHFENDSGHWFVGQIASNVDAVSSDMIATRRPLLALGGGLRLHQFGDGAGAAYCRRLRQLGYRIVYDPSAKVYDPARETIPPNARRALVAEFEAEQVEPVYRGDAPSVHVRR